jgi:two-component system sensor histidine kinase UhpB
MRAKVYSIRIPIEYTFALIQDEKENSTGIVLVFRDITLRKQTEAEIRTHESNLQRLSSQLINAQEAERGRLSRELHDEIGQALTAIKINLESIHKEIPHELSGDTGESFKETDTLVDNILDQIHQISLDLRPSILDDLGLVPTLNWYVKRFAQRMNIPADFSPGKFKERLDPELETVIYRVVQEALTNVAKHAQAEQVWVSLERDGENVRVSIEDDGGGFDLDVVTKKTPEKRGAGLLGIQERAMLMGGRAEIRSAVNKGTRIDMRIPWKERR